MDKLSSKHIIFIILGLSVVSLKTYPPILVRTGGRDAWVAVIVASILIVIFTYYIFHICKRKNCYSFKDIYFSSLGKFLGSFFIGILIITFYLTLIESTSVEANALHTNLLYSTPPWFFILFFIVPALYTLRKGKSAVIITTLIGITLAFIAGINLAILTAKYKHFEYLFPIFVDGISKNFISTTLKSLGMYSFVIMILPFAKDVDNKSKLKRDLLIGLILLIQMEIVSTIGIIATYGPERAALISYPKLIQTQEVSYFGFLESGEFFVMLQVVAGWFVKYTLVFYAMLQVLKELNLLKKYTPYLISILVAIPAFFISKNILLLFFSLNYFTYICLANFIIIPLFIFTIFKYVK